MNTLNPYLTFNGQCEEAMNFYKDALNGEIAHEFSRFGANSGMPIPEGRENWIMHSEVKAGNVHIMASDAPLGEVVSGTNVSLSLSFENLEEQKAIFNNLAKGGVVTMPLAEQFWGATFGMITDKFGIHWMLNCYSKAKH